MTAVSLKTRRWRNFCRNRRAFISLIIFGICFVLSLFAELLANDRPILVKYRGELHMIIVSAIWRMDFWLLVFLMTLFSWTVLVGVVRAEFLRARNFEYVQAARALGVRPLAIMFRHVLPNAMVATLTMLPFIVTGAIGSLAAPDFPGFGLPSSAPSLGELTLQAKQNLQAPWLGPTAFFVFALLLALLAFIFEGIRDAFDPRKTFS